MHTPVITAPVQRMLVCDGNLIIIYSISLLYKQIKHYYTIKEKISVYLNSSLLHPLYPIPCFSNDLFPFSVGVQREELDCTQWLLSRGSSSTSLQNCNSNKQSKSRCNYIHLGNCGPHVTQYLSEILYLKDDGHSRSVRRDTHSDLHV